jgi:hypothetical protein
MTITTTTTMAEVKKHYVLDIDAPDNMTVIEFLKISGVPSLAKLLLL